MSIKWNNGKEEFIGQVLSTFTKCNRVMSDIYADEYYANIWCPEERKVKQVQYNSSFELVPHDQRGICTIDAPEEVMRIATTSKIEQKLDCEIERFERKRKEAIAEFKSDMNKGDEVEVFKGRKVKVGTRGKIFWIGGSQYGTRFGVATSERRDADGKNIDVVWVAAANCRRIGTIETKGEVRSEQDLLNNNHKLAWAALRTWRFAKDAGWVDTLFKENRPKIKAADLAELAGIGGYRAILNLLIDGDNPLV